MEPIVITHRKHILTGFIYMFATGATAALLSYIRQNLTAPIGVTVLGVAVAAEFCTAIGMMVKGNSKDSLDEEGITTRNLFGIKTRLWTELKKYELGWTYGKKHAFAMNEEQLPYVKLVFQSPRKVMRLPYDEQIEQLLRNKCGAPKKDSWTQEKNKPAPEIPQSE